MKISHLLYLAALLFTAGCDNDGIIRPAPVELKVFNAASSLAPVSVNRETIQLAIMSYGEGFSTGFDSGQYDFPVRYQPVGQNSVIDLFTHSETLSPALDYLFIVTVANGQPGFFVVTTDDVPPSGTTARITIAHAFEARGDFDVYLEPPGTILSTVMPRTSISYATNPAPFEVNPGLYHIFLTTAGDPDDVLFESTPQGLNAGEDRVYVASDPGSLGTSDMIVSRIAATTGRIGQVGEESRIRVVQSIDDRLARDIYLDDTLTPPLFPAQPFGVISNYENAEIAIQPIITTPVGAPGTEENSTDYFALPGVLFTALIAGDSVDGVVTRVIAEDKRSIDGEASLRIFNGAGLFDALDLYLEPPGTDITTEDPLLFFSLIDITQPIRVAPSDYEVTVVDFTTGTTVAGPQVITMDEGGVYSILLLNSASGSTVDIQLFDDFIVP